MVDDAEGLPVLTMKDMMPPSMSKRMASHLYIPHVSTGIMGIRKEAVAPLVSDSQVRRPILEIYIVLVVAEEALDLSIAANGRQTRQGLREVRIQERTEHIICAPVSIDQK